MFSVLDFVLDLEIVAIEIMAVADVILNAWLKETAEVL